MIHLTIKIPHKVYVAVSGGPDSMAALGFASYFGKRDVTVLNFDHGTSFGWSSQGFVKYYCKKNNIKLHTGKIEREREKDESPEEYWRNERYNFFSNFSDAPIVLGHTLDDAVETWIFSAIHGNPKIIPIKSGNVIRPLLLTRKYDLTNWCDSHNITYLIDPANK